MDLAISFTVFNYENLEKQLETAFSLGYPLQLRFPRLVDFDTCIDEIAEVLSRNSDKVIALEAPNATEKYNTLFEDTVLIATKLEDLFDVNLRFISTSYSDSYKHIEELIDFYRDMRIHVYGSNPIHTMTAIAEANVINKFNRTTGLRYSATSYNNAWHNEEIISSLSSSIFEVHCDMFGRVMCPDARYRLPDHFLIDLFKKHCPNTVFTVSFPNKDYLSDPKLIAFAMSSFFDGYSPFPSNAEPLINSLFEICYQHPRNVGDP